MLYPILNYSKRIAFLNSNTQYKIKDIKEKMDWYISTSLSEDISDLTLYPREEEKSYPARISHSLKI